MKTFLTCIGTCFTLGIAFKASSQLSEGANFYLKENLKKLRTQFNVPAVSGTLVIDGKMVAFGATGIRKQGEATEVTDNDLFAIGSVTKTITGFVAAKVIEDNPRAILWTTRVRDLYPELAGLQGVHNGGLNSTVQDLNRFRVPVSSTLCLSHASCSINNFSDVGLDCCQSNMTGVIENCSKANLADYRICGRNEFVNKMMRLRFTVVTNGRYPYNNNSPVIVSAMLQRATNNTFENLMQENFFTPLAMSKAKLISQVTDDEADLLQLPFGHNFANNVNTVIDYYKSENNRLHIGHASGGVMMTPEDMGTYLIEILPGAAARKGILSDPSLTNYYDGSNGMDSKANGGWFIARMKEKIFDKWITAENVFYHNGGTAGFSSEFVVIPMKGFGFACVTTGNSSVLRYVGSNLVNMWYQKDFLQFAPLRSNTSLSNATLLDSLSDNNFLTKWTSSITNDAIIARPRGGGRGILSVPFKYVLLAYPRGIHNISKIQIYAKDFDDNEFELSNVASVGNDNTLFIFEDNVFAKELRIQFTNLNNKKTVLSEIKVIGLPNDRLIRSPIEKIMDPIKKIVDPVVIDRMKIISVKAPKQLTETKKP